jgi:uncharacterized membrane protein
VLQNLESNRNAQSNVATISSTLVSLKSLFYICIYTYVLILHFRHLFLKELLCTMVLCICFQKTLNFPKEGVWLHFNTGVLEMQTKGIHHSLRFKHLICQQEIRKGIVTLAPISFFSNTQK